MKSRCKNCNSKIAKHKTFCDSSCSATFNNKHRKIDSSSNRETKRVICSGCQTHKISVNKRSDPNKVRCPDCKLKAKYRTCVRCNRLKPDVKYNCNTTCCKCYGNWVKANGTFSKMSPDWDRTNVCGGYKVVFCPGHHRAFGLGYVHIHIIKAELKIGRLLRDGEIVHHRDENKLNNKSSNLQVFASPSAHSDHHGLSRHTTFVTAKCAYCDRKVKRRKGHDAKTKGYNKSFCDRKCFSAYRAS